MEVKVPSAKYLARPRYKQTEVGTIPEDWEVKRLGELASVSAGGTPSRSIIEYWNGNIPWITTSEVNFRTIDRSEQFITNEGLRNSAAKLLPPGTLLMALYGQGKTRGKVGILGIEAATNQACAAISFAPSVSNIYALHFLSSQYEAIRKLSNTGNQENLNSTLVRSIPLPLPPRLEQEAIAGALNDADALVESLERLLTKKRELKQGAMQEFLTGKRRLPEFSGEWEEKKLGEVGRFLKGSGVAKGESLSGSIRCIRYGEIYTRHNEYIKEFHSWISREVAASATQLVQGDILFAGSGETKEEIGKCAAFVDDVEVYAGSDIAILRPAGADPLFLGYYLNTAPIRRQKASKGQGDAVVHIAASALADIRVSLPSAAEQSAIATVLLDMDAEISAIERKLIKARDLKQGMMQELLTGRIRPI